MLRCIIIVIVMLISALPDLIIASCDVIEGKRKSGRFIGGGA